MPDGKQDLQSLEVVLDYKGAKLIDHRMDLKEFINSVSGLNELLNIVSEELGVPKGAFVVDIASIENGSLKVKIIPKIIHAGEVVGALASLYQFVIKPGYNYVSAIWENATQFVAAKKEATESNYFTKNLGKISPIQAELYQNESAHCAVEQFSQCLESEVEEIDMISNNCPVANLIIKNTDRKSLTITPFVEEKTEEDVQRVHMVLYLEGVHIDKSSKWQFIMKNDSSDKKMKGFDAEVLAENLLNIGREQALRKFENKPLYCTVVIKTIKKAGKKRASKEFFITDCALEQNDTLFPELD